MIAFFPKIWHDRFIKSEEVKDMEATLGKRIIANRKRLGLTQDQLAEKLGITAQAVSKWENDLSCPDISILPKLADIFGISTDELLGRQIPIKAPEQEIIKEDADNSSGFTYDSDTGKMDFHLEGIKLEGIGLAVWVILTGILYLSVQLLHFDVSFWNILWPTFFFVFGAFGLYPKFSVFRFGCLLLGGYFLLEKFGVISTTLNSGIIIAAIIVLFGISLLTEILRKNRKPFSIHGIHNGAAEGKRMREYSVEGDHFSYDANFGEDFQYVQMDTLRSGSISVNFGESTIDLSGVAAVDTQCRIDADCSFGELTILVPSRYNVVPDSSTSFASMDIQGHPDSSAGGTIYLHADVSFGAIRVQYV